MENNELTKQSVAQFDGLRADATYYTALNCPTNTFVASFDEPRDVISSRHGIGKARLLCIAHIPDELGLYMHDQSKDQFYYYEQLLAGVLKEYDASMKETVFLSTGVHMRNLAWAVERYEELWVACFTTAGVQFKRFGTICHIVATNATLPPSALVSSIITVTEAKNVALQELDIRSSRNPAALATGTGTDQVIVASGFGENSIYVQGHTKVGEMMALVVIHSTQEAIAKSINNSGEA
jgi:adenosylcobinamide amidohydrolase